MSAKDLQDTFANEPVGLLHSTAFTSYRAHLLGYMLLPMTPEQNEV